MKLQYDHKPNSSLACNECGEAVSFVDFTGFAGDVESDLFEYMIIHIGHLESRGNLIKG